MSIRRSPLPRRRQPIARSTTPIRKSAPNKVNRKRKASEFARCFHSRARVAFVKAMPCTYCAAMLPILRLCEHAPSDNAHTAREGMSRRGHYSTIAPLCRTHHRAYDEYRAPFDVERVRVALQKAAALVEQAWQERCAVLSVFENSHSC